MTETMFGIAVAPWARPGIAPPPGWKLGRVVDPFEAFCGPWFERAGSDGAKRYAFRVDERHVNANGVCHGGMLMTFVDAILGVAVWEREPDGFPVTISQQTNFLKAVRQGDLIEVSPVILRQGREMIFARGDFYCGDAHILSATSLWKCTALKLKS